MAEDETVLFGSLEECIKSLRDHEIQTNTRYTVGYSSKGFGKRSTGSNIVNNKRVQWLNGKPFISLGLKVYFCHHGKNYRPNNNARTPKEHGYSKGGRVRAQQTKKLGCPAKVLIKEGVMLPASHPIQDNTKAELAASLIDLAATGEYTCCYYMCLPDLEKHKFHETGISSGLSQNIDRGLVHKINELVDEGVSDTDEMERRLRSHVLETENVTPAPTSKRFFPNRNTIRNHMRNAEKTKQTSIDDETNLEGFLNRWKQDNTRDIVFLRKKGETEKFLFVYQSFGMKTLLERYGNTMTLLDATYRTTKYHLPLFFLVVKTNVDYQVVACFIPEEENSVSEQEALQIIKDHNPNWSPKHFMTDMDEREMHAMRSLFPGGLLVLLVM
ncbi:uncharacterized protein LOC127842079 [Dreissena polymorpha]|uniref:uncharacterized protein LOC127842079 n=1 Tax=Dreissena polymorpha TaxID=45954 RepID=UPI002264C6CF|nr:uncharacterized protein LOC127842079 [Dreissena polymorpha]